MIGTLITLAVFGIPMFFLIKYLNKRAEKEKRYYTPEQLREMEYFHGTPPCGASNELRGHFSHDD